MNRQTVGWGAGFVAASVLAVTLLVSAPGDRIPVQAREPSKLSGLELEIILGHIRQGDLRHLQGDLDGARRSWGEARRLGRGLWPIYEGLGDSYARARLFDEAVREYRAAEPLVPERHAAVRQGIVFKRAEVLAAAGRPLDALGGYLEVNQPGPLEARILDQALKADDGAAGKALSDRSAIFDPRVYRLLSVYHEKKGRQQEAAEALARFVIAVSPWEPRVNREVVQELREARKFDLALDVCRAWVRSTPGEVQVYRLMGDLLREAGREREALVAYTSIVDVRPGDSEAHRLLGSIFRELGRLDDAIAQFEAARKARPEEMGTWMTLVSLHNLKGDSASSEALLQEATKRFGLEGEARALLAGLYRERMEQLRAQGKREESNEVRRKLADLKVPEAGLFDLKIILTWDALSDVDLDVQEPDGTQVDHGRPRSKSGGQYYADNTRGHGPETYTLSKAVPGTYRIGVHLHGNVRSTARILVILYEDTPREERREETVVLQKGGEQKFIRDLVVAP